MRKVKTTIMVATLVICGILALLSILGAFVGIKAAQDIFSSMLIVPIWVVFSLLIVVSLVIWDKMLTQPGLLAMHVGCVCIIAGAMWGSPPAHQWREAKYNQPHPKEAIVRIKPNSGSTELYEKLDAEKMPRFANADEYHKAKEKNPALYSVHDYEAWLKSDPGAEPPKIIAELDFTLRCKKTWIEFYPTEEPWIPCIVTPSPMVVKGDKPNMHRQFDFFPLIGKEKAEALPGNLKVRILETWTDEQFSQPTLLLPNPINRTQVIPVAKGKTFRDEASKATIEILRSFKCVRRKFTGGGKFEYLDAPEQGYDPAVLVKYTFDKPAKDKPKTQEILVRRQGLENQSIILSNEAPAPLYLMATNPNRNGVSAPPCYKLEFSNGDKIVVNWMTLDEEFAQRTALKGEVLRAIMLDLLYENSMAYVRAKNPSFTIIRNPQMPSGYFADVEVVKDDKVVKTHKLKVNEPLHFGGFYFYMSSMFDRDDQKSRFAIYDAVVLVKSDAGLYWVYSGFALICVGLIIQLWIRPAFQKFRHERKHQVKVDAPVHVNNTPTNEATLEHRLEFDHDSNGGAK